MSSPSLPAFLPAHIPGCWRNDVSHEGLVWRCCWPGEYQTSARTKPRRGPNLYQTGVSLSLSLASTNAPLVLPFLPKPYPRLVLHKRTHTDTLLATIQARQRTLREFSTTVLDRVQV